MTFTFQASSFLSLKKTLWSKYNYNPHFIDEDFEGLQENLLKLTHLINGGAEIKPKTCCSWSNF